MLRGAAIQAESSRRSLDMALNVRSLDRDLVWPDVRQANNGWDDQTEHQNADQKRQGLLVSRRPS